MTSICKKCGVGGLTENETYEAYKILGPRWKPSCLPCAESYRDSTLPIPAGFVMPFIIFWWEEEPDILPWEEEDPGPGWIVARFLGDGAGDFYDKYKIEIQFANKADAVDFAVRMAKKDHVYVYGRKKNGKPYRFFDPDPDKFEVWRTNKCTGEAELVSKHRTRAEANLARWALKCDPNSGACSVIRGR